MAGVGYSAGLRGSRGSRVLNLHKQLEEKLSCGANLHPEHAAGFCLAYKLIYLAIEYSKVECAFLSTALSNFSSASDFRRYIGHRLQAEKQALGFDYAAMQEPEFATFNALLKEMSSRPLCQYADCGVYASSINDSTLQTELLSQVKDMQLLVDQYEGADNVNVTRVLDDPAIHKLALVSELSTSKHSWLLGEMVGSTTSLISRMHAEQ